jgi:hypothetical protein
VLTALDEERPAEVIEEFSARGLFSNLPVVSPERLDEVTQALARLEAVREELAGELFLVAAKLVVLAALVEDGREDIVAAIHEGNKVAKRARAVVSAVVAHEPPSDVPELVAAYALSGSDDMRMALESALQGGGD